ncbi:Pr6Pr family membrane protein [Streptomyces sp. NPDC048002]|uniref:Pr6Pr family membrane protein n=1 Tax=Streptomyces sp. NPDC048002 TaxID=3154344 RepID=UPI0033EFEBA1
MTAPIPRDMPDLPAIPGIPGLLPAPVPATAVVAPSRRRLTATFRVLTALMAVGAVTIECVGGSPGRVLSYFTVQSNLLLAAVMLLAARRAWTARRPLPASLTGAALFYVAITGLVYHLVLANASSPFSLTGDTAPTGWHAVANQVLHTVTPLAAALDWLLLTTPGALRLRHAAIWLAYPLAYLGFCLIRAELLSAGTPARHLYPFLDVDLHGYKSVLGNALLLGLTIYAFAVLLVALDHTRPDLVRRRGKTGFRLQPPVG